jgi:hypothetical protein
MTFEDRLRCITRCLNYTVAFVLLLGVLFIAGRVTAAVSSGRVAQILHNIVESTEGSGR